MPTTYLFRIDGAKDNDAFFAAMRSSVDHVFAGVDLHLGAGGWIPDLVKVVVEESCEQCFLTLIELEATESGAVVSSRKYLPENSIDILSAFHDYLDRIIRQCRTTADPREPEFAWLQAVLAQARNVTVTTAGGLRGSTRFVEELLLLDQPKVRMQPRPVQQNRPGRKITFHGVVRLTHHEAETLARCVMILDAVIRRRDHSATRFECWIRRARSQPLKRFLTENNQSHPEVRSVVFGSKHGGITLDCEKLLTELVELWTPAWEQQLEQAQTSNLIRCYFPVAARINGQVPMAAIFETARKHLTGEANETVVAPG